MSGTAVPPAWLAYAPLLEGLYLPEDFFTRAETYIEAVAAANRGLNLVSSSTEKDLRPQVVDALQALHGLGSTLKAVDVGTGGGFPGVPLALARAGWTVDLLDSVRKKQVALASILAAGPISNAEALWGRAEEVAHQATHRESYDLALCRAVGRFPTVLELTLPFLRLGGVAALHRGAEGRGELAQAKVALNALGGKARDIIAYEIPGHDFERVVIYIEKTTQTNLRFPRRAGIPAKRPL